MRYHCYKNIAKLMNEESFEWKDFWDGFIAITNSCTYKARVSQKGPSFFYRARAVIPLSPGL